MTIEWELMWGLNLVGVFFEKPFVKWATDGSLLLRLIASMMSIVYEEWSSWFLIIEGLFNYTLE